MLVSCLHFDDIVKIMNFSGQLAMLFELKLIIILILTFMHANLPTDLYFPNGRENR